MKDYKTTSNGLEVRGNTIRKLNKLSDIHYDDDYDITTIRLEPPTMAINKKSDNKNPQLKHASMWATNGTDYFATEKAVPDLKPGQYIVKTTDSGVYLSNQEINLDDLLVLPDSNSEKVLKTIEFFWESEDVFREHGFLWKRGVLLWGPPGSGKTSTVQQLSKQIVDNNGVTIYCTDPYTTSLGLSLLRKIESERPVVVIIEDIDAIIAQHGESELLAMLDGELQTDNVVFVATTNYPQDLDDRIKNRPSRFDEIIHIGMPTDAARKCYLEHKNPRLAKKESLPELKEWVESTDGFSIAHLKELIVSVECFKRPLDSSIARLREMTEKTADQYNNSIRKTFGFVNNSVGTKDSDNDSAIWEHDEGWN